MATDDRRVVIVGAGPAGATLALVLADRGIQVELLERHQDFAREFRGERIVSSGLRALQEAGLERELRDLPQLAFTGTDVYEEGRFRFHIPFDPAAGEAPVYLPQPTLLEALWAKAAATGRCDVQRGAVVRDLVRDERGCVIGVQVEQAGEIRTVACDLAIGCDGRTSTVRRRTTLETSRSPDYEAVDVVWIRAPVPPSLRGSTTARLYQSGTSVVGVLPAPDDTIQVGWIVPKGGDREARRGGTAAWLPAIEALLSPDLQGHLSAHVDDLRSTVLDVSCNHLTTWWSPGVLLLGDAAHPMSPAAGQGISMALRDAIVAANHLVPVLRAAPLEWSALDAACQAVQDERLPEIIAIQDLQRKIAAVRLDRRPLATAAKRVMVPVLARVAPRRLGRLVGGRRETYHGITDVHLTV